MDRDPANTPCDLANLELWLNRELDEAADLRVVRHLSVCPHCRVWVEQNENLAEHLTNANSELIPSDHWIQSTLDLCFEAQESSQRDTRSRPTPAFSRTPSGNAPWSWGLSLAATLFVALGIVLHWNQKELDETRLSHRSLPIVDSTEHTAPKREEQAESQRQNSPTLNLPMLTAGPGFLASRVDTDEPDFDFYVVLPSSTSDSK